MSSFVIRLPKMAFRHRTNAHVYAIARKYKGSPHAAIRRYRVGRTNGRMEVASENKRGTSDYLTWVMERWNEGCPYMRRRSWIIRASPAAEPVQLIATSAQLR